MVFKPYSYLKEGIKGWVLEGKKEVGKTILWSGHLCWLLLNNRTTKDKSLMG